MGLTSLESIEEFIGVNYCNYVAYHRELAGIPGIRLMSFDERERCNFQYIVIEVDAAVTSISRDILVQVLHAENVMVRRYFFPGCHRMEPYRSYQPQAHLLLSNTEALAERIIVLPTGTSVQEQDIALIASIIRVAVENSREVVKHLEQRNAGG
jgi:dTDP-4-amino-4,6-dideoxygalactose transaminase